MRTLLFALLTLPAAALAATGPYTITPTCTAPAAGAPTLTQRNCVAGGSDNHVWLPSGPTSGWEDELVVILPGTNMEPDKHDQIAQMAAVEGFRTISLAYDNRHLYLGSTGGINTFCGAAHPADTSCGGSVANTILWGPTVAPPVAGLDFDDEDSVQARLLDALAQAHANDMLDGINHKNWDTYEAAIAADDWCNVIVAGFSQGSTVTAVLASQRDLGGAVMLDGPSGLTDVAGTPTPQDWRTGPHDTAGAVMFGAYHTTKTYPPEDTYSDLGMATGTFEMNESDSTTWTLPAGLHRLDVNQTPHTGWGGCTDHFSMARDDCMALDASSTPILAPAYQLMFRRAGNIVDPDCM